MLKKDIQPRPAYLKWVYIGMMTIAFWNGGLGLPWFTKYVLQVGVLGMALLFMLVTGDFRRLKTVGQFAVMFGLPFVMMAALSMLYWALDFQQLNYMSRGCSTILYHVISLSAGALIIRSMACAARTAALCWDPSRRTASGRL